MLCGIKLHEISSSQFAFRGRIVNMALCRLQLVIALTTVLVVLALNKNTADLDVSII